MPLSPPAAPVDASPPHRGPLGLAQMFGKHPRPLEPEEERVLHGMHARLPVSRDAADVADERATFGDRLSDRVAAVGGSWAFIIAFSLVLLGWMLLNSDVLARWG